MEIPIEMDDLGVPPCSKAPIYIVVDSRVKDDSKQFFFLRGRIGNFCGEFLT